ncbi:TPA: KAP family P-loop NTPase fold protein [Serratia fonticola]
MRLTSVKNDFSKGFDSESDIFSRKPLYEQILNIALNASDENLVLALDDKWGNGKTSFVKMMESEINIKDSDKLDVIYFDAFASDYQSDPFISLSSKIYNMIEKEEKYTNKLSELFLNVGKKVGASFLTNGVKYIISASTANIVSGTIIDKAGDIISDSLSTPLEDFIAEKIKSGDDEDKNIEFFKAALKDIYHKKNKKTLFIIDELDRARPDFSLDLLERIKHLFSVDGFIFLLVMNRQQFEKSIECRYGEIDSRMYLNKFINFWFSLPKIRYSDESVTEYGSYSTIMKFLIKLQGENPNALSRGGAAITSLAFLLDVNKCSLREAERCYSIINIIEGGERINGYRKDYQYVFSLIAFLKIYNPDLIMDIIDRRVNHSDLVEMINLKCNSSHKDIEDNLSEIIEYALSSDQELESHRNGDKKYNNIEHRGIRVDFFSRVNAHIDNLIVDR